MKKLNVTPEKVIAEAKQCPFCLEHVSMKGRSDWNSHLNRCKVLKDKPCIYAPTGHDKAVKIVNDSDGDSWVLWLDEGYPEGLSPLDEGAKKSMREDFDDYLADLRTDIDYVTKVLPMVGGKADKGKAGVCEDCGEHCPAEDFNWGDTAEIVFNCGCGNSWYEVYTYQGKEVYTYQGKQDRE